MPKRHTFRSWKVDYLMSWQETSKPKPQFALRMRCRLWKPSSLISALNSPKPSTKPNTKEERHALESVASLHLLQTLPLPALHLERHAASSLLTTLCPLFPAFALPLSSFVFPPHAESFLCLEVSFALMFTSAVCFVSLSAWSCLSPLSLPPLSV